MITPHAKRMTLVLTGAVVVWAGILVAMIELAQYIAA